ncbi:hypothetical protein FBQ97_12045, partial [Acidobacteria bacterium ACD]|nr:hypothetical protein [Acidobacteria bacterium ACD]
MLDPSLSAQLQQVYRDLPVTVVLRQRPSDHPKQAELTTMLEDLATTNPQRIVCRVEGEACAVPAFEVGVEGKAATVLFKGIPGGHEYTSLVLAVLNTAGQGKRPDEGIQARIREAGAGAIDLDHLLVIAQYFDALPDDVIVFEMEPVDVAGGEGL